MLQKDKLLHKENCLGTIVAFDTDKELIFNCPRVHPFNTFFKEMYRAQFGEFIC